MKSKTTHTSNFLTCLLLPNILESYWECRMRMEITGAVDVNLYGIGWFWDVEMVLRLLYKLGGRRPQLGSWWRKLWSRAEKANLAKRARTWKLAPTRVLKRWVRQSTWIVIVFYERTRSSLLTEFTIAAHVTKQTCGTKPTEITLFWSDAALTLKFGISHRAFLA